MALPTGSPSAPITVLLTVRSICLWLCSMSGNGCELYPDPKVKRRRGSLAWLLGKVQLRAEEANFTYTEIPETLQYRTAVDLWFEYIRGYLFGFISTENPSIRAVVVRQDDILHRPQEVVEALRGFGATQQRCVSHHR